MKKLISIFLCATLLFSFSACTQKEEDLGDNFILGTDNQQYFNSRTYPIAESESHYYLFGGFHLFSKNKQTGEFAVLCDKPDCLHDHERDPSRTMYCNAFFEGFRTLHYANDKLYVLSSIGFTNTQDAASEVIYEIDISGANRKKIFSAKEALSTFIVHRDYMYLSFTDFYAGPDAQHDNIDEMSYYVERIPINKPSSKPEIIFTHKGEFGQINSIYAYGNQIYFSVSQIDYAKHFVYQLQSKEATQMSIDPMARLSFVDSNLLFFEDVAPGAAQFDYNKYLESKATVADLLGKPVKELDIEFGAPYTNSNLIITDNESAVRFDYVSQKERKIKIYDKNGEFMKDIFLHNSSFPAIGMNEDYYFYLKQSEDETVGAELWAIDLSKIDDPNLEGEKFFSYQYPEGSAGGAVYTPFS